MQKIMPENHPGIKQYPATRIHTSSPTDCPTNDTPAQSPPNIWKKAIILWNKILKADGADQSGLSDLIYTSILNNASDAGMLLPLASILLFGGNSHDSKFRVAIYLLVTLAPYAIIAPFLGPLLDKLHSGRRLALAGTFAFRSILAIVLVCNASLTQGKIVFPLWLLYPCTLLMMLSSKSYIVLKAAIIPRVVPPSLDLVQVNSRTNTFSSVAGTIFLGGTLSSLCVYIVPKIFHIEGGFLWMAILTFCGALLCLHLPEKIEGNKDEISISITNHFTSHHDIPMQSAIHSPSPIIKPHKQLLGSTILTCLWGVCSLKVAIGFLYLFMIFYPRSPAMSHITGIEKLLIAAAGTGATGLGGFIGNILGAKIRLGTPQKIVCICAVLSVTAFSCAAVVMYLSHNSLLPIVIAALITATCANSGKVSLDSSIQDNLAHNAQASAFGLSESLLQISWVLGAALGALLPPVPYIAFTIISLIMLGGSIKMLSIYRSYRSHSPSSASLASPSHAPDS